MGREIRRVKPGWEHPKYSQDEIRYEHQRDSYRPLYDEDYDTACEKWYAGIAEWKPRDGHKWYHDWEGGPPDHDVYREEKWTPEEATWFQVYETVSEGTPVTPAFATKKELVDYLVANGDYWDQKRGNGGWSRENAEGFVEREFAFSMIISNGQIKEPRDQ